MAIFSNRKFRDSIRSLSTTKFGRHRLNEL